VGVTVGVGVALAVGGSGVSAVAEGDAVGEGVGVRISLCKKGRGGGGTSACREVVGAQALSKANMAVRGRSQYNLQVRKDGWLVSMSLR